MTRTSRSARRGRTPRSLLRALPVEGLEARVLLSTCAVTTAADSGDGSLRSAILAADAAKTAGSIVFDIPGSGVRTIQPLSALPAVTAPVLIDGTSQPGYAGSPLIALDGSAAGRQADGLNLTGVAAAVQALDVEDFSGNGVVLAGMITLATGSNCVQACYIGTDPTGTLPRGNGQAGVLVTGTDSMIGGAGWMGNVISANRGSGIVAANGSTRIEGNFIGTDVTGTAPLGNGREGVDVFARALIGGAAPDADVAGNVISGNASSGVMIVSGSCQILGANRIGTNASGTAALGNGFAPWAAGHDGVTMTSGSLTISDALERGAGGNPPQDSRNVISGNKADGVNATGTTVTITGSYFGTDVTGSAGIPNGLNGISAGAPNSGTPIPSISRNVISGNGRDGLELGPAIKVTANLIGTDSTGSRAVPNGRNGLVGGVYGQVIGPNNVISGNEGNGVVLSGGSLVGNYIGVDGSGESPLGNRGHGVEVTAFADIGILVTSSADGTATEKPEGNVISANGGDGILAENSAVWIGANLIGTDAKGTASAGFGNGRDGIAVYDAAGSTIGGRSSNGISLGNTVKFNGRTGITAVGNPLSDYGGIIGNQISQNSIYSNGGLGIDLGDDGVTPNSPPSSPNSNNWQDFPVVSTAVAQSTSTLIAGTVQGRDDTKIMIEVFDSDQADQSGYGEGQRYIGTVTVTTDNTGNASFQISATPVEAGTFVTATATALYTINGTNPAYNTSEFSAAVKVTAAPAPSPAVPAQTSAANTGADPAPGQASAGSASSATYLVTNTADSGEGSLRSAITAANSAGLAGSIIFNIPVAGVQTIQVLSPLPAVTAPVVIDGRSQPGWNSTPLIVLDGSDAGSNTDGLTLAASKAAIRALDIESFSGNGIVLQNDTNMAVTNCFIGVDATGTIARGNGRNGILDNSSFATIGSAGGSGNVISSNSGAGILENGSTIQIVGNRIGTNLAGTAPLGNAAEGIDVTGIFCTLGGTTLDSGNVISANASSGVLIEGYLASAALTGDNRIGTNLAGTAPLGNGFSPSARFHDGVTLFDASTVIIKLATVGAAGSGVLARNVISGNSAAGVSVTNAQFGDALISGSYIGTDATGSYAIPNGGDGVDLSGGSAQLGSVSGGGNVISGNRGDGVRLSGGWTVASNYIGTNAAGTAPIPNGGNGIVAAGGTIGPVNLISGNAGDGLLITGNSTIVGNFIGTDATGSAPLGTAGNGIEMRTSTAVLTASLRQELGTTSSPNLISANAGSGILINGDYLPNSFSSLPSNQISGALIGTSAAGIVLQGLGNAHDGVTILNSGGNTIGDIGSGNTIAGNGRNGVSVIPEPFAPPRLPMNDISGNSIFSNVGLGIDLGDDGVTPNTPPIIQGEPVTWQDFPVITTAIAAPNGTVIAGTVQGRPQFRLRVELFENAAPDPSGFGEGRWYLGSVMLTPDSKGNASFVLTTLPVPAGAYITGTATQIGSLGSPLRLETGNTSEFSAAVPMGSAPKVLATSFHASPSSPMVSFQFDQNVSPLLSTGSLLVNRLTPTGSAPIAVTGLSYDLSTNTATFTLAGPLSAGNYQALFPPGSLIGSLLVSNQPGGEYAFGFSVASANLDGNAVVDFRDLVILASHYGQAGTFADGDLNGDGKVDFNDLVLLAQQYGTKAQ